jgi:hypothetical protein
MVTLAFRIFEYTKVKFYKPKKSTMIIAIIFICTALLGALWIKGIDTMSNEHSDYNGNDLI